MSITILAVYSQTTTAPQLTRLSTHNGLSGNRTRTLAEDPTGEVWIGSQNGLNHYNGYEVKVFQRTPKQVYGITDNFIHATVIGPKGQLWVGTARAGVCRYDPKQEQFLTLRNQEGVPVLESVVAKSLCIPNDSTLWVGTNKGLYVCRLDDEFRVRRLVAFRHDPAKPNSLAAGMIMDIVQTDPHTIWAGSYHDGLCRINLSGDTTMDRFVYTSTGSQSLRHDYLHRLFQDHFGNLWIGTDGGAFCVKQAQLHDSLLRFERIDPSAFDFPTPYEGTVNDFAEDQFGTLWFISNHHLHQYQPQTQQVKSYSFQELGAKASGANIFMRLMIDQNNRFWICSMEGVYYSNGSIPAFQPLYPPRSSPTKAPLVRAVAVDSFGYVWLGTEDQGVKVVDMQGKQVMEMNEENGQLHTNFVTEILVDRKGTVWVGLFRGGLYAMTVERDTRGKPSSVLAHHFRPPQLDQWDIEDMLEAKDGTMWLASLGGLVHWIPDSQLFKTYRVRWGNEVIQTMDGSIWLATSRGLFGYDAKGDSLWRFEAKEEFGMSLKHQMFLCAWPDSSGGLWAGTPHGLYHIELSGMTQLFREEEGLSGNLIQVIQGDQEGNLWVGTQKGLTCLEPKAQSFASFYQNDGVLHQNFAVRASTVGPDGRIYMGGDHGLMTFLPDEVRLRIPAFRVQLTSIDLFNQPIPLQWQATPDENFLPASPNFLEELVLTHTDQSFSIKFAAPVFGQTHRLHYRTRLIGFSAQWQQQENRSVTFTNLNPGSYQFEVQASLDEVNWSTSTLLPIRMLPPWYQTWWAYVLYAFMISILMVLAIMIRIRRIEREYATADQIRRAREEERETVRKRSARDFHDEAGNRLTKLALYTELTKRMIPPDTQAQQYLQHIEQHVGALSSSMRDFIWVLNPGHDTMADTLKRIMEFGNELFEDTSTQFRATLPLEAYETYRLQLKAKRHLLLIMKEAMNNTLKYAQASQAQLDGMFSDQSIVLVYQDNGKGFDTMRVKRGQGLSNMESRAEEIGMKLQLDTAPNQGVKITCIIDITQMGNGEA